MLKFYYTLIRKVCLLLILVTVTSLSEMIIKETKVDPFSLILDNQRSLLDKIDKITSRLDAVDELDSQINILHKNMKQSDESLKSVQSNFNSLSAKVTSFVDKMMHIESKKNDFEKELRIAVDSLNGSINDLFFFCNSSMMEETQPISKKLPRETVVITSEEEPQKLNLEAQIKSVTLRHYIESKVNKTHDQLFRMLSLLHNIEYRQHISSIAQDRRLSALLEKMAIHETKLMDQLQDQIFQVKLHLETKINDSIENSSQRQDQEVISLLALESNKTHDIDCLPNTTNCLPHQETINADESSSEIPLSTTTIISDVPEQNLELNTESLGLLVYTNDSNYPSTTDKSTSDESIAKDLKLGNVIDIQYDPIPTKTSKLKTPTVAEGVQVQQSLVLQNVAKLLNEQMQKLDKLVSKRISSTEEKLQGIRILQSSAFYTHSKEIRYEIEKLERGLQETIHSSEAKLSKRLDGTKKSLLTFIDAAVTSISSAAVTSAQSTGVIIAKQLKRSMQQVENQFTKVDFDTMITCPNFYQRVGNMCLILLHSIKAPWVDSCQLCHSLGGTLISSQKPNEILKMTKFLLHDNQDTKLWLKTHDGGSCANFNQENAEELTNSVLFAEQVNQTALCPAITLENSNEIISLPCDSKLGVICQYQPPNCSHQELYETESRAYNDLDFT